MIKTINFSDFCDSFSDTYKNNFTYKGKRALFDYLEQLEEDTSTPIELDPIALCCDYTEYDNMEELQASYPDIKDIEDLENHTQVIQIENSDSFIIQNY